MITLKKQQHILLVLVCLFTLHASAQQVNFEFIENKGQWDKQAKFMGNIGSGSFFLQKQGFTVLLHNPDDLKKIMHLGHGGDADKNAGAKTAASRTGYNYNNDGSGTGGTPHTDEPLIVRSHAYRVNFEGANNDVEITPEKAQESYNNYFIGNDKSKWASHCKIYKAVTYHNIYPGIDIRYYPDNGTLKYDIIVNPGANTDNITMKYEGVDKLTIKNNQLYIKTSVGEIKELYPYSYQFDKVKGKTEVNCKYEIINGNTVKFKIKNYSRDIPLVIDPTLRFSSFSGSTTDNWGFTATPGPDGSLFGGGIVFGTGYPITTGAYQSNFGGPNSNTGVDMGITRFSPLGNSRMYSTYLGGSASDFPCSLITDAQANLVVMGRSYSADYPGQFIGPAAGSNGSSDLVVTKLNALGDGVIGSLRIGGRDADAVNVKDQRLASGGRTSILRFYGDDDRGEVILDNANNIYVATQTQSSDFPVVNAFQPVKAAGQDAVILKIDPTCNSIIFSSFFGGTGDDGAFVIDISPITGNIYAAGATFSTDLPGNKTGVYQGAEQGDADGFVTEIASDGSAIIRTTYVGTNKYDAIYGIKFDKFGFPYVMGITEGTWPVKNAAYFNPDSKQFISKLEIDLSAMVFSTVFGTGPGLPNISPVAFLVDRCENMYVSGWGGWIQPSGADPFGQAGTAGMPITPGTAIKAITDNKDFYFIVLQKNSSALLYGSFFGQGGAGPSGFGEHVDGGTSRYDKQGVIYQAICANCEGNSFGTPNPPYQTSPDAIGRFNGAGNGGCNLGVVKIAFNFAGVDVGLKAYINTVFDTTGCVPLNVEFKDTVRNAVSYEWNFGDGSPTVATTNFDITHIYNTVGTYRVMLVGIDSNTCNVRDTTYINVRVRDNQAFLNFVSAKLQPCESLSYQFTNTSTLSPTAKPFGNQSFIWDFGDGTRVVSGPAPIVHSYVAPGTYKVKLILPDTGYCNSPDSITRDLRVAPLVKAQFETPLAGCAPYNAVFNNTSLAGQSFFWDFGDGNTSTDINPTHLYSNPGSYTIKLVATDTSTCNKIDSITTTISISTKPTAAYTYSPLTPQQNFPYTFTNGSSPDAVRFLWSFGDGETLATISRADIDHQYNTSGTFNACLAAYNNIGCADTICKPLQNIILPRLDLPNAFTPLANSNNIIYVRGFGIGKMKWRVYNRFGNVVFESDSPRNGWNGTYKGVVQPMEVYAYTLEVEFTDGTKASKKGDITLLR